MSAPTRLTPAEALALLQQAPTADLLARADEVRRRLHGAKTFFVHSLNLNPSNLCENRCDLCAYWREADADDAYLIDLPQAREILRRAAGYGLTELHVVGGLTEKLDLAYYESLFGLAREELGDICIQGITAVEVHDLARRAGVSIVEALRRLKQAGLDAIPGGGAEIFSAALRQRLCAHKIPAEVWLDVHRQAQALGIPTNATMLFGHLESDADIIDHMTRLRDLQDQTGGFRAFIPLPFHPAGTKLPVARAPGGHTIARVAAVARLFLDNIPHLRVLAAYTDHKLLQVLLHSGVDDLGGTSLSERIAKSAGAPAGRHFWAPSEIDSFVRSLSLDPVLTNSLYLQSRESFSQSSHSSSDSSLPVSTARGFASSSSPSLRLALGRAESSRRLSASDALALHEHAPLHTLGLLADRRRNALHDPSTVTFVIDRNINLTNVCSARCRFCAFHVAPDSPAAFTLTIDQVVEKVRQAADAGATQILLQGGLNEALDLSFYERVLAAAKAAAPVWLHCLSPAEVKFLTDKSGLSVSDTLARLRAAGLDSLPGGGAEILVDDVRRRVSPHKISAADWLAVMSAAAGLGMKASATMVYGLGETPAQRVEHLMRIRDLQDATGVFTAFIPWSFQSGRTDLPLPPASGGDYLRVLSLARLVLDNVPHLQAGWVTEGPDLAQVALSYGADDWGGLLMEEHVVAATGLAYSTNLEHILALLRETGRTPAQRSTQYEILRRF
ncbi:MAG: CofH family radical SAM protein [Planctomycetota bacterium]|nr:CofH family radical SAM protein [Planctomycetota bacterium]